MRRRHERCARFGIDSLGPAGPPGVPDEAAPESLPTREPMTTIGLESWECDRPTHMTVGR